MKKTKRKRIVELERALVRANQQWSQAQRRLEVAAQLLCNPAPPVKNQVSFVGGPLDGSKRVLEPTRISGHTYSVPIFAERPQVWSPYSEMPSLTTGTYRIFDFGTKDSTLPYHVGVWEGVR